MTPYFIYVFLDPRKPGKFAYPTMGLYCLYEPYYLGKGKHRRIEKHFFNCELKRTSNLIKTRKIVKIKDAGYDPKDYVIIFQVDLSEAVALSLEIDYIKIIGRIVDGTGPLANITIGGEGVSGYRHVNKGKTLEEIHGEVKAAEMRRKFRECKLGAANPVYGKSVNKGKKHSAETIRKASENRAWPVKQLDLECRLIRLWPSIRVASTELNISYSAITCVLSPSSHSKQAGGFKWEYEGRHNPKIYEKDKRYKRYKVIYIPTQEEFIVENISEFGRKHKIAASLLSNLAYKKITHKKWFCEFI